MHLCDTPGHGGVAGMLAAQSLEPRQAGLGAQVLGRQRRGVLHESRAPLGVSLGVRGFAPDAFEDTVPVAGGFEDAAQRLACVGTRRVENQCLAQVADGGLAPEDAADQLLALFREH